MKRLVLILGLLGGLALPSLVSAQCPGIERFAVGLRPAGHQQLTVSDTAIGLTVPTSLRVRLAVVSVQTDAIRSRDDGTDPTAAIGTPWAIAEKFYVCRASLASVRFIRQTTDAILDIDYYGD